MGLLDDIRSEKKGIIQDTSCLLIEQKLNQLFYMQPNIKEELEMLRLQLEQSEGDRYGLHASAIIGSEKEFCIREQVLSLFYKQSQGKEIPVGLKRIFEEGNAIHLKWQRLFIRGGLGKAKNMDRSRFNAEYELSYTPDAMLKIGGKKYVFEIKSVNTFQFKKLTSHPSGKKQLQFYMYLTGIHNGVVLCDDKNTQEFKIFKYAYEEALVEPFVQRLKDIQRAKKKLLRSKVMPERKCESLNCKRALSCNMRDACYNIGIGRIKLCRVAKEGEACEVQTNSYRN